MAYRKNITPQSETAAGICDRCGYAPVDYAFHMACHDYLDTPESERAAYAPIYQAALVGEVPVK